MIRCPLVAAALLSVALALTSAAQQQKGGPTAEEIHRIRSKVDELEAMVIGLKSKHADENLVADVEVYEKAGRWLLEFPENFFTQDGIDHALAALDTGLERARQLQSGQSPWMAKGRQTHGYYSALDGSVQPYGVTVPESYDGTHPVRLYVWLHGRAARLSEAEFLYSFPNQGPSKPPVADAGQIQLDVYGRWNGAGYHFAGEADVFEAMAAVQKRYKIDGARILLRGFSMGGEGAWNLAVHYPDRWAAAEIGAGTWSRRPGMPGLMPYQEATLRIWENYTEWALNFFNLPLAGHDGDSDTQVSSLPPPPPGTPTRGQLESSIKVREQLVKEGFPSEGEPNFLKAKGTPAIFLISEKTGHGTSPEVRQQLDAFLKEWGDRGQVSPDHIRFVTYTTRYNRDYWVSLDGLEQHYQRAEIDAERSNDGKRYRITTTNLTRLTLRETNHAAEVDLDGERLRVKAAASMAFEKTSAGWRAARGKPPGLHKTHALQGPIDDAFLDPFLLVRPTGTAWNEAVNQQALRTLARFDRLWAKWFRAHPRVVDDKDVTQADFARYNVVLFGDPGSNRWIAKINGDLPVRWTRETVTLGGQQFAAAEHYPALIFPNPLNPSRYVVLNSGLTIDDREYRGDYGMPRWGDFAVLKVKEGAEVPDVVTAGLFDEAWQLPKGNGGH
jgi:pimeloyl-ACP methyl ester carboxylesterase